MASMKPDAAQVRGRQVDTADSQDDDEYRLRAAADLQVFSLGTKIEPCPCCGIAETLEQQTTALR